MLLDDGSDLSRKDLCVDPHKKIQDQQRREQPQPEWRKTGSVSNDALLNARLQAHIAAHVAGGPAKILAEPEADYGHVALTWYADSERGMLATQILNGGFATALQISSMSIMIVGDSDRSYLDLEGLTLSDAQAWVHEQVETTSGRMPAAPIPAPKEWPQHPIATGAPFDRSDSEAFFELERHFNNAAAALGPIAERENHAGPVRTWPHHFDTATLVSLDPDKDPEVARSINFGFSPGDEQIPEPYWYVVPYPDPKRSELPALPGEAYWITEGYTGALLKASTYRTVETPESQLDGVATFLNRAHTACRELLEEDSPR